MSAAHQPATAIIYEMETECATCGGSNHLVVDEFGMRQARTLIECTACGARLGQWQELKSIGQRTGRLRQRAPDNSPA